MKSGVDPRCIETMSLYEIISMMAALEKFNKTTKDVTDEEFEKADELIRSVTLNDPKVRL